MRFITKWLLNAIVIVPLLMWLTEATFWSSFVAGSIFSVISYVLGDQIMLQLGHNKGATIADVSLCLIYFWLVGDGMNWTLSLGDIVIIAILIGVEEFFIHRQIEKKLPNDLY